MDEGAFVNSLLAPDMRAAPASVVVPSAVPMPPPFALELTGRRRAPELPSLLDDATATSTASPMAIAAGRPSTELDDALFRQFIGSGGFGSEQDDAGSLPPLSTGSARSFQMTLAALGVSSSSAAKDSAVEKPPTSTNSLLFEPLELPKTGISAPLDPSSIKDVFAVPVPLEVQDAPDSPVVSPPNSACSLRSLASGFQADTPTAARSSLYSDLSVSMPVQPLGTYGQTYFASSAMGTTQAFTSDATGFSMSMAPSSFWTAGGHSVAGAQNLRGVMDGFDSASPPGSMRHLLFMASGVVSPPSSSGSNSLGPLSGPALSASLLAQHQSQQQQQQQLEMWADVRALQTPTAMPTAGRGKKRARSRTHQSSLPSEQLSILAPSMTPTSQTVKQLVVSADKLGKDSNGAIANASGLKNKRARTVRLRSPCIVSPVSLPTPTPTPTPTGSPSGTTSSSSDGDAASLAARTLKGKKCVEPGCIRRAQSNSRCKAHGGGARCQFAGPGGCSRSSQGGGFCRAHGGGKRCEFPGCVRGQQRKGRCYVHGGIRRCQWVGCEKKDRGNGFCIAHGGGKRCTREGCARAVRRGSLCQLHDGSRLEE